MLHGCYGLVTVWKQPELAEGRLSPRAVPLDRSALAARRDGIIAILGCGSVLAALTLIWASRAVAPRNVYVSELGAAGMSTQYSFMAALLALVVGGALIAWAGRGLRSDVAILRKWTPAVSLWIACGLFLIASQVPCTYSCPSPWSYAFTWQDGLHIAAAVAAFAFSCLAMLQASLARRHRAIAVSSAVCAWSVAGIAGAGGLLALFGIGVDVGAWCEFIATTIAIAWVVMLGAALAVEHIRASRTPARP